jgi:hypothetical protein
MNVIQEFNVLGHSMAKKTRVERTGLEMSLYAPYENAWNELETQKQARKRCESEVTSLAGTERQAS